LRKAKPQRVGHPGGFYCFKDGPPPEKAGSKYLQVKRT
jgi:hypothetical protein